MELKKMDFQYSNDITVINKEQFDVHMRLYEGYINKINEIDHLLATSPDLEQANSTYSSFRGMKRGESFALDGVILHEYYFENIGSMNNYPDAHIISCLTKDYGSYENWKQDFIATGRASRGWAVLCYDIRSMRFRNNSLDAHDVGNISTSIPILVLDVYEHAYFLQYSDKKADYIDNFMKNINWSVVKQRIEYWD